MKRPSPDKKILLPLQPRPDLSQLRPPQKRLNNLGGNENYGRTSYHLRSRHDDDEYAWKMALVSNEVGRSTC